MKLRWLLCLALSLCATVVFAATYTGNTVPDLTVTTPDGSVEPVSILDDALKETKRALTGTYYDWVLLTNSTGGGLVAGDVVCYSTAGDSAVVLCDTADSLQNFVVATGTIASAATGYFARSGRILVNSTGAIARGQYVSKSVTTKVVKDSGTAQGATTAMPSGTIGLALTAAAANQLTVQLFGATVAATVPAGFIGFIDSGSCPSGYTELTAARGFAIVGVPSGGTLAGTAGSATTDLQNTSVTPTFTGSALSSHTHPAPVKFTTATGKITDDWGTDATSRTEDWTLGGGASAGTDTGWSITGGTSGGTPAGTNSAVTGNAIRPYIQLMGCKKS